MRNSDSNKTKFMLEIPPSNELYIKRTHTETEFWIRTNFAIETIP